MKRLLFEDISNYKYLMSEKEIQGYTKTKILMGVIPLLGLIPMLMWNNFSYAILIPVSIVFGFKFPFMLLKLRHNQQCNDIIIAVPLWLNVIYALLEKNTIHNSIMNSLDDNTPEILRKDLTNFTAEINANPEDKSAYLSFLKTYAIEGLEEIMLKLFEFRSLDKSRLKEEFIFLNTSLEKINKIKRVQRFKSEVNNMDYIVAAVLIGIPCIYLLASSMMPELYSSFM